LNFNILMEAQDDYFVNLFTPLYKTLPKDGKICTILKPIQFIVRAK